MLTRTSYLSWIVWPALAFSGASHAAPPSNSSSHQGVAYRWVDEQGVVHYGDHVPPEDTSKERAIINGRGVEVGHLDAQKSADQIAADERTRAAAVRKKEHDSFLMTTYTSVKDIEGLRDSRLGQLKGQREAAEQYVESLRSRLGALQTRALVYKPYSPRADARRMPDDLAENLVRTANELKVQSGAYAAKSAEEAQLRAQFQADIERYRELSVVHAD
ncbi:MAG TPA: DUF4124 domain-containing protein [Steroidobacteraceae bacterium]|jgi:hypothetical protein